MAIDNTSNLPGVKVTYEDNQLHTSNQTQAATTKSILLIGTAVDGPVGEPVRVRDLGIKATEKLFGGMINRKTKQPNQASLIRGMHEAIKVGNDDIRLLRVGGKHAKTELKAKDIARNMEQYLGEAEGNTAFVVEIHVPAGGKFVGVSKVEEIDKDGNVKTLAANSVIDYVDTTSGSEKVYFYADKIRPGHSVRVHYDYETRNYTMVPKLEGGVPDYSDPDYTLTQDASNNRYFYSARKNWSDRLESGHIPVVVVKNNDTGDVYTIASTNPNGDYIYRIGKGQVSNPLTDPISAQDYKDGGIFFTTAYDDEVAKGVYPALTGNITVTCEYAWYTAYAETGTETSVAPGVAVDYNLDYTPIANEFSVYYVSGTERVTLTEGVDYGVSLTERIVTINAGVAPVGAQLYASYKTSSSTVQDPYIEVLGKYPGSVYGSLTDLYDKGTLTGVKVEVQADPDDPTGMEKIIIFHKPEEKRLSYKDDYLVYKTKNLANIKTIRQFVNYVNNDASNNIVTLYAENDYGNVPIQGLLVTEAKYLGEEEPGKLKEDMTKPLGTLDRYPWLGDDGLVDVTNPSDMDRLYTLLGGRYELVNGEYKLVEQGIYSKLENYVVDEIQLLDVYANTLIDPLTPEKNFATQLAQHCATATAKTWETIGIIGVAPALSTKLLDVQEYIDLLTIPGFLDGAGNEARRKKYEAAGIRTDYVNEHYLYNEATHEYVLNDEGDRIDIGRYISVVFGPEVGLSSDKIGNYVTSGSTVYAALISTLSPEVSTTNRPVSVIRGLRYNLSEAQHSQLIDGRYVTFTQQIDENGITKFVVKDGVTAALANSDYTRLSTLRIVHTAVQLVRRKATPFIGLPNGLAQRNALAAEIQAGLDKLKENGLLQRFKFTIFSSVQDKVLGNAFITLELVPEYETRQFNTSVVLRAA